MTNLTNNCQFIGRLGNEPVITTTQTGKKVAKFSIAATEAFRNADGKRVENTSWINLTAWEGLAETAEKYLHKGKQVAVCGRLVNRSYDDKKGEKKFITEVVVTDILMLGKKED